VPATRDSKISATHCVQLRKQLGWPGLGQQDLMPTLVGMSWEAVPFRGRSSHIVRICFTVFHDNHLRSFSLGKPGMGWREMSMDIG